MSRTLAVAIVIGVAGSAAGQFVYNTFGPGWSYEEMAGSTVSGISSQPGYIDTANKFTAQASGNITDIWIAIAHVAGADVFELWLMADAGNVPGDVLESWVVIDQGMPWDGQWHEPIHLSVNSATYIQQGADYWLCAHAVSPDGWYAWHFTDPWIFETVAQRFAPFEPWNVLQPGFTSAYAIAVPEPAAAGLLVLGFAGLLRARWLRLICG